MTDIDSEPFRYDDGMVRDPLRIVERFARSKGQSWSDFEIARAEARRYLAYLKEGPDDPELRSVWEANGWWLSRRPSRLLIFNPHVKYHEPPRLWLWHILGDLAEKAQAAIERHADALEIAQQRNGER